RVSSGQSVMPDQTTERSAHGSGYLRLSARAAARGSHDRLLPGRSSERLVCDAVRLPCGSGSVPTDTRRLWLCRPSKAVELMQYQRRPQAAQAAKKGYKFTPKTTEEASPHGAGHYAGLHAEDTPHVTTTDMRTQLARSTVTRAGSHAGQEYETDEVDT